MAESQFQPFNIESADRIETQVAPDGYRPHWDNGPAIDADAGEPTMPCWRQYFAGGSNKLHFILIDDMENPHIVEQDGFGGPYSVYGPDYSEQYENAYDAFWHAENITGIFTDPAHQPKTTP